MLRLQTVCAGILRGGEMTTDERQDPFTWFVARGDSRRGPLSDGDFRSLIMANGLAPTDMVWRSDWPDWRPATDVLPRPKVVPPPLRVPAYQQTASSGVRAGTQPGFSAGSESQLSNRVGLWIAILFGAGFVAAALQTLKYSAGDGPFGTPWVYLCAAVFVAVLAVFKLRQVDVSALQKSAIGGIIVSASIVVYLLLHMGAFFLAPVAIVFTMESFTPLLVALAGLVAARSQPIASVTTLAASLLLAAGFWLTILGTQPLQLWIDGVIGFIKMLQLYWSAALEHSSAAGLLISTASCLALVVSVLLLSRYRKLGVQLLPFLAAGFLIVALGSFALYPSNGSSIISPVAVGLSVALYWGALVTSTPFIPPPSGFLIVLATEFAFAILSGFAVTGGTPNSLIGVPLAFVSVVICTLGLLFDRDEAIHDRSGS